MRTEKVEVVKKLADRLGGAKLVVLAEYRGLKVSELRSLRREIKEKSGQMQIVKNRLALRAFEGTPFTGLSPHFKGPTALVTSTADPVLTAKALAKFVETYEAFKIRTGFVSGRIVDARQIAALSKLPSPEELYAMLLGTVQAPITNFARALNAVPRKLAIALKEIEKSKAKGG